MGQLTDHFQHRSRDTSSQNSGWSELWKSDQSHLWDRGKPSPALIDFVEGGMASYVPKLTYSRRPRALVPGCGKGYDVVMLALHGFDAWGLEVSQVAVDTAKAYAQSELANPGDLNFGASSTSDTQTAGSAHFVCGDFFSKDWYKAGNEEGVPLDFDLIYDYTFLCAVPPELRFSWANQMRILLASHGILVCLEFPLYKDLKAEGPPYGLAGVHWNLLAEGGDGLLHNNNARSGHASSSSNTELFDRVLYYQPEHTYEVGKGTDMLSVWNRIDRG